MVRSGLNKIFCYIYLHLIIILNDTKICVLGRLLGHTPPEGGVRTKKFCITFDTIFGRYLPRGTKIGGSRKCRMGAFCTIVTNSGEILKKALKTGQNGVKCFFSPHA